MGLKREIVRTILAVLGVVVACSYARHVPDTGVSSGPTHPRGSTGSTSRATDTPDSGNEPRLIGNMLDSAGDAMAAIGLPEAKAEYSSGRRIKARWNVGDDGSREFAGWQDTELNTGCAFVTAADGVSRCLPISGAAGTGFYADSACTTPQFSGAQSQCQAAPVPRFGLALVTSCNTIQYRIFPITGTVQPANIYTGTPANCVKQAAPTAGYTYFSAGAELPASGFVAAHVETDN